MGLKVQAKIVKVKAEAQNLDNSAADNTLKKQLEKKVEKLKEKEATVKEKTKEREAEAASAAEDKLQAKAELEKDAKKKDQADCDEDKAKQVETKDAKAAAAVKMADENVEEQTKKIAELAEQLKACDTTKCMIANLRQKSKAQRSLKTSQKLVKAKVERIADKLKVSPNKLSSNVN